MILHSLFLLVIPAKAGIQLLRTESGKKVRIQVTPPRIGGFDRSDLPCAFPFLDRLLAQNWRFHRLVPFEPDWVVHAIASGETFDEIVLVDARLFRGLSKAGCRLSPG
jgi:hypothetical protein